MSGVAVREARRRFALMQIAKNAAVARQKFGDKLDPIFNSAAAALVPRRREVKTPKVRSR